MASSHRKWRLLVIWWKHGNFIMKTISSKRKAVGVAAKKKIVRILKSQMRIRNISITALAKQLDVKRISIIKLLDPNNTSITLGTILNAADALGLATSLEPIDRVEIKKGPHAPVTGKAIDPKRNFVEYLRNILGGEESIEFRRSKNLPRDIPI